MRNTLKFISTTCLIFLCHWAGSIHLGIAQDTSPLTIRQAFDVANIETTFLQTEELLPHKDIPQSPHPFIFPGGTPIHLPDSFALAQMAFGTEKYLDSSFTQGLIVIQDDSLVYEKYGRGQTASTPRIIWSVTKSYVSALMGIAIEEGHIESIEQTIEEYVPELKGSGYEGVRIKDVLQMSSGIKFDETYGDPDSDINRWFTAFCAGDSQDKFAASLTRERVPGTFNKYVSMDTHVLGMVLTKATGRSLTDYLQEKLWNPIGSEFDAYWLMDNEKMEMALGGLNICLRDAAKLGLLFLHEGNWKGKQIVPASWIAQSTRSEEPHLQPNSKASAHPGIGYGYQWWIPDGEEGEFLAIGVFNQYIYINPTTKTVIAKHSANKNYYDGRNPYRNTQVHLALFRAIAHGEVE
ncbi:MAG: serine hydrolase [Bacteroidota bacterium]